MHTSHRVFRAALFALSCLALDLPSRADAQKLPEEWNGDGLVVGQIVGVSDVGFSTAGERKMKAIVGRRGADGGVFRGVILFKRGEGEHELKELYDEIGTSWTSLPIGRKFEAKKGQITVLGLMLCVPSRQNKEQFRIVAFDNADETLDYLRRIHPVLLAGHENASVVLATGMTYQPKERLVAIRTSVARSAALRAKRQGQFWVAGRVGTIAEVKVSGDSVQVLRFLPPVTYQEPIATSYETDGALLINSYSNKWRVANGVVEEITAK
jgi:hypothetical protein